MFLKDFFKRLPCSTKPIPPIPANWWRNPYQLVAFGFGSGLAPFAPGTFGTLAAIPFYLLFTYLSLPLYLLMIVLVTFIGAYASEKASAALNTHDHPGMCIDEFAGYFVTMINAPQGLLWIILGFILFRLFDIAKPWPISWLDKHVDGGIGMMLDDIVAGLFAMLILQGLAYYL